MGKIELDHTGSGGGVTLSSDGTDLLLDGTAVGGGPTFYAETFTASDPLPTANGTSCFAIGAYSQANAFGTIALGYDVQANSLSSTSIGRNSNGQGSRAATGHGAMALGGSYASGTDSLAAAITNNTSSYGATGSNSVAIGYQAKATNEGALAFGHTTTSTGQFALALGYQSTAAGTQSVAIGRSNQTGGNFALALGYASNASASNSVAIGDTNTASHANAITIGDSVQSTTTNEVSIGGTTDTVRISESYTLPTADGTNGQVLTTDGSGAVTFADAGGGGFTSIVENYTNGTAPTVTGSDSVGIGDSTTASGSDSYAIGHYATAAGSQAIALGFLANVSSGTSTGAAALGYQATVGAGASGVALGKSYVSGADSLAAAITNNTSSYGATGANSIAIGQTSKASDSGSVAIGKSCISDGGRTVALGHQTTASGFYSFAVGALSEALESGSVTTGVRGRSNIQGKRVHSASTFSAQIGNCQTGELVLGKETTDATPVQLTSIPGNPASTNNQIILPNNSAYAFHGTIVARQQASGGTACAAWKVEGLIRREGSAGTTVLVNSATTVLDNTPSWGMALSADTTNGGLAITVTGAASTNIRWVATIHTSEVTYA